MKIFIRLYQSQSIGICKADTIHIPNNKINVSQLKEILFEKYRIDPSQQRLTVKIANTTIVTMTNEWPLSFFYIRENSKIYLEFLQIVDKNEELKNKMVSNTKSKYLKSLGFFKHITTSLETIPESQVEFNEGEINKNNPNSKKNMHLTNSMSKDDENFRELIVKSVKNNSIQSFRELMDQNDNYEIDSLGNTGWSLLHYACFHGYADFVMELITKYHSNVNLPNQDGWTPLHLCSYKGYHEIVIILLSNPEIDVNRNVPGIGTPMHCACKKNNLQVVSILLHKANFNIADSNGNLPVSLTTDRNIKKLISKYDKPKKTVEKKKTKSQLEESKEIEKFSFLKRLIYRPPRPAKTVGYLEKMGTFIINFHQRYIEIDPIIGSFRRFKTIQDYPNNPVETIPLRDIISCKKITSWYSNSKFYFEICYQKRQVYRLNTLKACEKWIEIINSAIIYGKFWSGLIEKNPEIYNYYWNQKEELETIKDEKEDLDKSVNNSKNIEANSNDNSEKKNVNSPSNISSESSTTKKKERRRNPHSMINESEEEVKLTEDSSLTKGINFSSFDILQTLGSGTFGKVFKVRLKSNGNIYAMKIINKKYLIRNQQLRYAVTECNVLKQAKHPFIITLHYAFQTPEHLYMILDYCPGGDLSFHIARNLFEEDEAKFFIAELILAIEHLHSMDIIYRDLKPENILIDSEGHIRLADFGLAKENVTDNKIAQSFCGSPAYLAPEMVNRRGAGKSADIYGIGAVLYEMISGTPPFYANDLNTMYKNISRNNLMLHDYFSEELKDLLKLLLSKDPKTRIGVQNKDDIKSHEFFSDIDWDKLFQRKIMPPIDLIELKNELNSENSIMIKESLKFNDIDYDEKNSDYNRVRNYTFIRSPKPNYLSNNSNKQNY